MAIAFVNKNIANESVNDDAISCTLTGVTAGNCLVVVSYNAGDFTATFTDDKADTFGTTLRQYQSNNGNQTAINAALNVAGGDTVVTVTFGSNSIGKILAVLEYSGVATSSALDQQSQAQGDFTITDPGTITPTTDGQLIVAAATDSGNANQATPAGSFTERYDDAPFGAGVGFMVEDYIQATAAAITDFWTTPNNRWAAVAISLKAAAAAGPGAVLLHAYYQQLAKA